MRTSSVKTVEAPSEDKRWRLVTVTMRRHGYKPYALIETLHTIQEAFGYLDEEALRYVAHSLKIPLSRVYGVATFYNTGMFAFWLECKVVVKCSNPINTTQRNLQTMGDIA